jgi:hypothetical protein
MAGLWLPATNGLNCGEELEEVLAHEARGDLVATGEVLDLGLGPAPTLLGFDGRHEARAAQARHVGRVPVGARFHEGVHRRVGRRSRRGWWLSVFTNTDLPLRPVPYRKNSACSCVDAGQRVADHPLQVGLKFLVAARDLGRGTAIHCRAVATGRGRGDLGHPVGAVVRALADRS